MLKYRVILISTSYLYTTHSLTHSFFNTLTQLMEESIDHLIVPAFQGSPPSSSHASRPVFRLHEQHAVDHRVEQLLMGVAKKDQVDGGAAGAYGRHSSCARPSVPRRRVRKPARKRRRFRRRGPRPLPFPPCVRQYQHLYLLHPRSSPKPTPKDTNTNVKN